ncbi:hypothetical protein ACHAQJ_006837 [Trichoderma viride]
MSNQLPSRDSASTDAVSPRPQRLPYSGSCHCGTIRYIVFLTLPPASLVNAETPPSRGVQRIYRCNCTVCHKSGFLHVRPASAFDDFLLLSPLDPLESLGDYLCNNKTLHNLFCKKCAIRCFTFHGEGETIDMSLSEAAALPRTGFENENAPVKAWRPKRVELTPGIPHQGSYLSVNGQTIDVGQDGFDLREWVESKAVGYLDCLNSEGRMPPRSDRPQVGGSY